MRSLELDNRSRGGVWFIVIAAVVLAAWVTWFLRAGVAQYERTDHAVIEALPGGGWRAVAWFPASAAGRVRPGQPARVLLGGAVVRATVATSPDNASPAVLDVQASSLLRNQLTVRVEVQTENLTPAALLLRAAGQGQ